MFGDELVSTAGDGCLAAILLLPQPLQVLLNLIALDLFLQRADLLLALQVIDLLLLAHWVFVLFDAAKLLVGLQPLELLVVS